MTSAVEDMRLWKNIYFETKRFTGKVNRQYEHNSQIKLQFKTLQNRIHHEIYQAVVWILLSNSNCCPNKTVSPTHAQLSHARVRARNRLALVCTCTSIRTILEKKHYQKDISLQSSCILCTLNFWSKIGTKFCILYSNKQGVLGSCAKNFFSGNLQN